MNKRRNNRLLGLLGGQSFPQLVANPSAETGAVEPDNWFHTLTGTEWATQGHSGSRSLRVTVTGDIADWRCSLYPVVGGRRYRVGLWVKGSGTPEMILASRWFSDSEGANYLTEQWLILNGSFSDWTPMSHIVAAPANALTGDLMFRAAFATTADLYGDDFSVRRLN